MLNYPTEVLYYLVRKLNVLKYCLPNIYCPLGTSFDLAKLVNLIQYDELIEWLHLGVFVIGIAFV